MGHHRYHIAGVLLVSAGILMVSLSTFVEKAHTDMIYLMQSPITGIMFCLGAQIFLGAMLVYEEHIMSSYTAPPFLLVGMEGAFGLLFGLFFLLALNAFHVEDIPAAQYQLCHSVPLLWATIGTIFSMAFFNSSGVAVTHQASAVARSTIDVSRTAIIWGVELLLGWNTFNALQLTGFVMLAAGTMIYNRLIVVQPLEPHYDELCHTPLEKPADLNSNGANMNVRFISEPSDYIHGKADPDAMDDLPHKKMSLSSASTCSSRSDLGSGYVDADKSDLSWDADRLTPSLDKALELPL